MKKENIITIIAIGCIIIGMIIGIIMYSMPKTYECKNCHSTNIELKTTYKGASNFQCNECHAISTYYLKQGLTNSQPCDIINIEIKKREVQRYDRKRFSISGSTG